MKDTKACLKCGGEAVVVDFERNRPWWICRCCDYAWAIWSNSAYVWKEEDKDWTKIGDGVLLTAESERV